MTKEELNWWKENEGIGRKLGYPYCCIKEFCDDTPKKMKGINPSEDHKKRFKAGCINGKFTGFIPCIHHAKKILSKKISLASLIKNREKEFPEFPKWGHYEK